MGWEMGYICFHLYSPNIKLGKDKFSRQNFKKDELNPAAVSTNIYLYGCVSLLSMSVLFVFMCACVCVCVCVRFQIRKSHYVPDLSC